MRDRLADLLKRAFSPGHMGSYIPSVEERVEQKEMAEDVLGAFFDARVSLIEAGTGIGKSLAYLVPAILWAAHTEQQVVVSTNTIALQEQLLSKEIPLANDILGEKLRVVLAQGMGNYVCTRKVQSLLEGPSAFLEDTKEEKDLLDWCQKTLTGSRSDYTKRVHSACWGRVSVDSESCIPSKCQYASSCFFLAAREELQKAHLIITNHHLLLADLKLRVETGNKEEKSLLPPIQRLILDEAHHLEDIASHFFSSRLTKEGYRRLLSQLLVEPVHLQWTVLKATFGDQKAIIEWYKHLRSEVKQFLICIEDLFDRVDEWIDGQRTEEKIRLRKENISGSLFQRIKEENLPPVIDTGRRVISLWEEMHSFKGVRDSFVSWRKGGEMLCRRFEKSLEQMVLFFDEALHEKKVHWVESVQGTTTLVQAYVDISDMIQESLFAPLQTAILCSATLTAAKSFDFIRSRLGFKDRNSVHEAIYPSPFPYHKNSLFMVPTDLPSPLSGEYQRSLADTCVRLVKASDGGALILFTSYSSLKDAFKKAGPVLESSGYCVLCQGDTSQKQTIELFRSDEKSILFATSSFWEGVDVPGRALRLVVITRLPFDVPSDPLAEARSEAVRSEGKNPFVCYSVPRACVRFKQAFGRLIRRHDDRGCVVCLDSRVVTKSYGKYFFHSLPECPVHEMEIEKIIQETKKFV